MQKIILFARGLTFRRSVFATMIETGGFVFVVAGVGRLASPAVALIVAGVFLVLKAYEVDR